MKNFINILRILFRKNHGKNVLLIVFLFISNLVTGTFLNLINMKEDISNSMERGYLEHLSLNVSTFTTSSTNNNLVNVKSYKRPSLDYLSSLTDFIGDFVIRPDYTPVFNGSSFSIFGEDIQIDTFIVHNLATHDIGINRAFFSKLQDVFNLETEIIINMNINLELLINQDISIFTYQTDMKVGYIYDEPSYLTRPKIFLSQAYIDNNIGNILINNEISLTNYLLSLPPDNPLTNYRLTCHFANYGQLVSFKQMMRDMQEDSNIELSSDVLLKVESFTAIYLYISLLAKVFLVFIIIANLVVYFVIVHTSLLANMRQMTLLAILGAEKHFLYCLNLSILGFNLIISGFSFFIIPTINMFINSLISFFFNFSLVGPSNSNCTFGLICLEAVLILIIFNIIYSVQMRKPLLYLLLDD